METVWGRHEESMETPRGHHEDTRGIQGDTMGTPRGQPEAGDSLRGHLQDLLDGAVARGHEVLGVLGHADGLQPLGHRAEGDALGAAGAGQADGDPAGGRGGVRDPAGTVQPRDGEEMRRGGKEAASTAGAEGWGENDAEMGK